MTGNPQVRFLEGRPPALVRIARHPIAQGFNFSVNLFGLLPAGILLRG